MIEMKNQVFKKRLQFAMKGIGHSKPIFFGSVLSLSEAGIDIEEGSRLTYHKFAPQNLKHAG
mgnify:CR=1 FL=1